MRKLKENEKIKIQMLNEKVITEILIQNFTLDTCEAVIIEVSNCLKTIRRYLKGLKGNINPRGKSSSFIIF